ncbi:TPA: hypothetical protein NY115_000968 [Klebsiella michiganensis]|nr:hypothetical protein [Klebsiella michiganensis]
MLENYLKSGSIKTDDETKRLIAVQAALEIAKASVGSSDAATTCKTDVELKYVSEHLAELADAIQDALKIK